MNPGDKINVYYNPENPQEIGTLVLLGKFIGSIILAAALAFLAVYVWFFWLRGFLRRPGPHGFYGDVQSLSQIVHRNGLRARLNGSGPHQEISIS